MSRSGKRLRTGEDDGEGEEEDGDFDPMAFYRFDFQKKNLSKSVLAFSRQQQQEMLQQAAKHVEKTNEEIVRVQVETFALQLSLDNLNEGGG